MWLKNLTGFPEQKEAIQKNITLKDGKLETPSLKELRARVQNGNAKRGKLKLQAIRADVKALHLDQNNANALF